MELGDLMTFSSSQRRTAALEAGMPLALRTFGMLLDMNVPFAQALRVAGKGGAAGEEFSKIADEVESGASVPNALAKSAGRSESQAVKKAMVQLISAYEHGAHGKEIMQIADDLISLQRYRMRDFVSKSSLFGLLFIIFAAVAPTFFLVLATAGRFALGMEMGKETFLLVFLALFPLIDALILATSDAQLPPSVFGDRGNTRNSAIFFGIAAVLALVMLMDVGAPVRIVALAAALACAWFLFRNDFADEGRVEEIEAALPDALLGVSGMPKNYGVDRIFEKLASGKGALSEEAGRTLGQLRANVSVEAALSDLWRRNSSFMLRRMGELMLDSQLAGANVSEKMHEMAEDLLKFGELRRERGNALAMQKYTLMLGALIVPVILSASLSLVSQISGFVEGMGDADVLKAAPNAILAYIIAYSALSAYYISKAEQRNSAVVQYFAAMAAAGLIGFYILAQQFI